MLAAGLDLVRGWLFVEQLDIGSERRSREQALEQVVAEQAILGHSLRERRDEGVDIVDALADERTFAEQILVHVGYGRRIRIDARRPGGDRREP